MRKLPLEVLSRIFTMAHDASISCIESDHEEPEIVFPFEPEAVRRRLSSVTDGKKPVVEAFTSLTVSHHNQFR